MEARIPWVHSEAGCSDPEKRPPRSASPSRYARRCLSGAGSESAVSRTCTVTGRWRVQRREPDCRCPGGKEDPPLGRQCSSWSSARAGPLRIDGGELRQRQRGAGGRQRPLRCTVQLRVLYLDERQDAGVRRRSCGEMQPGVLGAANGPRCLRPAAAAIHRQCLPPGGTR